MFHRIDKKAKPVASRSLKELKPFVQSAHFFAEGKRPDLIQTIQENSGLEITRFEQLALSLMLNLSQYFQNLPETAHSFYSLPGGLMDYALNRTEAALQLFRGYVLPEGADLSEAQVLWGYALLTASLLKGVGKIQTDYRVDLFDTNGQFLETWNPLLKSMSAVGRYYYFEFEKEGDEPLRRRLNLLFAQQLMPAGGFAWIVSNPEVLEVWLALLNEDWQDAGTLGALLVRADAIAIQRYITEHMSHQAAFRNGRGGRFATFVDTLPDSLVDKERLIGIEFLQWLTKALDEGRIMINKAPLFMVPGGMLITAEMFQWFAKEHPDYKTWQAVQNGFLALGFHRLGRRGQATSRFEQAGSQQMIEGVVFSEYAVALPGTVQVQVTHTGKIATMSAAEFIHTAQFNHQFHETKQGVVPVTALSHLAANGQWQQGDPSTASQKPGAQQRG